LQLSAIFEAPVVMGPRRNRDPGGRRDNGHFLAGRDLVEEPRGTGLAAWIGDAAHR
jgi:hypothetical protein